MAERKRLICESARLVEGGQGVRFTVGADGVRAPAFVLRFKGKAYAYFNRCAHIGLELDWLEAQFFDNSRLYLLCATHGASYEPTTGACVSGPCRGGALTAIEVVELDGKIYTID
jgi:nitrite reductase/ring-hydroxylating ferredoxin subunit